MPASRLPRPSLPILQLILSSMNLMPFTLAAISPMAALVLPRLTLRSALTSSLNLVTLPFTLSSFRLADRSVESFLTDAVTDANMTFVLASRLS